MKIIKTIKTVKDNELEKTLKKYPRKIDLETLAETLLNWDEKSSIWLFYVTKVLLLPEINSNVTLKARLQVLKNEALEDEGIHLYKDLKDNELGSLLSDCINLMDVETLFDIFLNWEEKSFFWLSCLTKILETSFFNQEQKESLRKTKHEVQQDSSLSETPDTTLISYTMPVIDNYKEEADKIDKMFDLGFDTINKEEYYELISKTDWQNPDCTASAYMVFDGDLTISEKDFKLFYEVPTIITGNLTVGGNLTELFNFGTLMVFGDLYTTSLDSWESTLYVQGTLFAKQAVILSSGDYISGGFNIEVQRTRT